MLNFVEGAVKIIKCVSVFKRYDDEDRIILKGLFRNYYFGVESFEVVFGKFNQLPLNLGIGSAIELVSMKFKNKYVLY